MDRKVLEIILIAQDLGDFGKDRREKNGLSELLMEMLKDPRDFWLRLLYLYPDEIDDHLIEVMKSDRRICPYLDMPIQHINDSVLQRMHRKTSQSHIIQTIQKLRKEIPDIAIRTSLIVGFPGETEPEFQELVSFVREYALDHVGIFQFSSEKEAPASELPNPISEKEKQRRFEILSKEQHKVVQKKNRRMIGRRFLAIVDGPHPDSKYLIAAHHSRQCPEIDGQIIINDAPRNISSGKRYIVEITDAAGVDLIGRIIEDNGKN